MKMCPRFTTKLRDKRSSGIYHRILTYKEMEEETEMHRSLSGRNHTKTSILERLEKGGRMER